MGLYFLSSRRSVVFFLFLVVITGKKALVGNNVSHSNRKTKRRFEVNLFTKKFFWPEEGCWIVLKVSAAGLRLINKIGLDAAVRQAANNGYLSEIKVK